MAGCVTVESDNSFSRERSALAGPPDHELEARVRLLQQGPKTLDTLRLPTETYSLFDQTKIRYDVDVEFFYPDMTSWRVG